MESDVTVVVIDVAKESDLTGITIAVITTGTGSRVLKHRRRPRLGLIGTGTGV